MRDEHTHTSGAFLFPQMTLSRSKQEKWSPFFVDYLFLAFNTSTALSPTDVPVLYRWAKVLMMVQSVISLAVSLIGRTGCKYLMITRSTEYCQVVR